MADTKQKQSGRTTPKGTKPDSLVRLQEKKGLVKRINVYLDSEVHEEYEQAQAQHQMLDRRAFRDGITTEAIHKIEQRYEAAKAAEDNNVVTMVLMRPVVHDEDGKELRGRAAYEYLLSQFQPSEEDIAEYREQHANDDPDGVPAYSADMAPHLISACLTDPVMSPEEVEETLEEWTFVEYMQLFSAAMQCSTGTQLGSLGKESGVMSAFTRS